MAKVQLTIRAFNKDGYSLDILVQDEIQVRMNDSRVKMTAFGVSIKPEDFPEMVRFETILKEYS